jgi:hypothetical protein
MDDTTGRKRAGKVAHLRLPEDLHAALAEYAARTDRTLNSAAVYLLRIGLQAEGPATPDPTHLR